MVSLTPLKKENLTYPEWEQQDGENGRQHFIFDLFCRHGGTPHHFAKDIKGYKKGHVFQGVEMLYDAYAETSIPHIAALRLWIYRRECKTKYLKDYRINQLDKIDDEDFIERYIQKKRVGGKIWDTLERQLDNHTINGTQTKDYVTAANGVQESQAKDKGEDSKKIEFEGKIDSTTEVKTDMQVRREDFQKQILEGKAGKRLEDKLKDKGVLPDDG